MNKTIAVSAAGVVLLALGVQAAGVRVEFNPQRADVGPFPTDFLTVPDATQRTLLRVNLPQPNCNQRPSDCGEVQLINQLDGFSVDPQVAVRFSGAIRPESLRDNLWIVWLEQTLPARFGIEPVGKVSPLNRWTYDPATFTGLAKPDSVLEGSRLYLLIATDGLRDTAGDPLEASDGFAACMDNQIGGDYCIALSRAVRRWESALGGRRVLGASLFTTMSATAFLEEARTVVSSTAPEFRRAGQTNVVPVAGLTAITWRQQVQLAGTAQFRDDVVPVPPALLVASGVGRIAFGSFRAPRFTTPQGVILQQPTGLPLRPAGGSFPSEEIGFHVWLPATPAPPGGYPVILAGHGFGDSRFGMPSALAVANGFNAAVVAMNAFGHGYGPQSSVLLNRAGGSPIEFPAPGRGLDLDGNNRVDGFEGCILLLPGAPLALRDCLRQTVSDYMQLVHAIRDGIDLDGDGRVDLSQSNINYLGQSLGGMYGAILSAVEPDVQASVLNVPLGLGLDSPRMNQRSGFRPLAILGLGARQPSLLNAGLEFDEQLAFRNDAVSVLTRPGARDIQDFFERSEWLSLPGEPLAYAPHLRAATLPGVPLRRILFQMALGDHTAPNPTTAALIRSANLRERTWLYRHDVAKGVVPGLPDNPHSYLVSFGSAEAQAISAAVISQAVSFLLGRSDEAPDVNPLVAPRFGRPLFEIPAELPERLNLIAPPR
jgi:hypothetical protein